MALSLSRTFKRKNARRLELIDKEFVGTITNAEMIELEELQEYVGKELEKQYPLPPQETAPPQR